MDKVAESGLEKLFNYGILGVIVVLLIITLWFIVKHYLKRQTYWENKLEDKHKEQMNLTKTFTDTVSDFKDSHKENTQVLKDIQKDNISHTEVLRELKTLIHRK